MRQFYRCHGARIALCWFFFNDTATTEIYTLSLHDALPISTILEVRIGGGGKGAQTVFPGSVHESGEPIEWDRDGDPADRKSTRLNSSHANISYAVFCLKKKTRPPDNAYAHTSQVYLSIDH